MIGNFALSLTQTATGNNVLSDGSTGNFIYRGTFGTDGIWPLGQFLVFIKMPYLSSSTLVYTREAIVTKVSTEVDATLGSIPPDEVVFRTRHISRKHWAGQTVWERRVVTPSGIVFIGDFTWAPDVPIGSTQISEARKRFYDPFVPVLADSDSQFYNLLSDVPDTLLDAIKSNVDGTRLSHTGHYSTDPEWVFFTTDLVRGQYLRFTSRLYEEQATRYSSGAYTTPLLDDSVPSTGPSGSESEISGGFTYTATVVRV
jgi:hypothetical protein